MRTLAFAVAAALTVTAAQEASAQITVSPRAASIKLGGRLHPQYASSSVESTHGEFFFRRARLTLDATVNGFFDARISPEFAGGGAQLKDAYVRFKFSPALHVTMGQFKRPFDIFGLASSTDLSIIERDGRVNGVNTCGGVGGVCSYSRLTERLNLADRDQGVRVGGTQGKVTYEVAVTNGTGANKADENGAKSFAGRLSVGIADGVTVSAQGALHDYPASDSEDRHAGAWGADLEVGGWRDGFMLQASWIRGENWKKPDGVGDPATFTTFQAVASYHAPVEGSRFTAVEPLLRLSYGDPDTALDDDGGFVVTPGLMFYVTGKNKVGLNVDVWSPQAGDTQYSLKVQTFVFF